MEEKAAVTLLKMEKALYNIKKKGGYMDLSQAVEIQRLRKAYLHRNTLGGYVPLDGLDIVIKKQAGVIYAIVEGPNGLVLPLLESEVTEFFQVKEATGEQIIHYIWLLTPMAKFWQSQALEFDWEPISRYENINKLTDGMALMDCVYDTQLWEEAG
ncbi:hypothetical protein [Pontibacter flavimaris]|uniref:Uncharacterized protein n=1 Tax=Pontibacter flavimaris TaxID=1797110 RepID=A0A1Q5PBE8_9BACT|nr:hypothetical protein [Pontibacter flavimaris]OKL39533.1 hypothetical protein A3841_00860 [Pontibacter flavimaris]